MRLERLFTKPVSCRWQCTKQLPVSLVGLGLSFGSGPLPKESPIYLPAFRNIFLNRAVVKWRLPKSIKFANKRSKSIDIPSKTVYYISESYCF
jgi:hypothetical protein